MNSYLFSIVDFSFASFIDSFPIAFIVAILTFAFSIMLRSGKMFLLQLGLFLIAFIVDTSAIPVLNTVMFGIQLLLGILIVFKYKKAFDRNYQLVLEKTHQVPPNITIKGNNGGQR